MPIVLCGLLVSGVAQLGKIAGYTQIWGIISENHEKAGCWKLVRDGGSGWIRAVSTKNVTPPADLAFCRLIGG